jgi:predicted Zn-dependent peptidase
MRRLRSKVIEMADKYCGEWDRAEFMRSKAEPKFQPSKREMTDAKLSRKYTMAMTPGPSAQDDRRFAARVLADVIGDSEGSRFYWSLVDNAIAEDADFGFYPHDGCGSFYVALVTEPDRAEKAMNIAKKELRKIRTDISADEVERAKNKISSSIVLQGEAPMGRMRAIASQWVYGGDYRSLEMDMATLAGLNIESLRSLLDDFPLDQMTVVTLGPE